MHLIVNVDRSRKKGSFWFESNYGSRSYLHCLRVCVNRQVAVTIVEKCPPYFNSFESSSILSQLFLKKLSGQQCFCLYVSVFVAILLTGSCAQQTDNGRGNGPKAIASGSTASWVASTLAPGRTAISKELRKKNWLSSAPSEESNREKMCVHVGPEDHCSVAPEVVCCDRWIRFKREHPSWFTLGHVNLWCGYPCDLRAVVTLHTIIEALHHRIKVVLEQPIPIGTQEEAHRLTTLDIAFLQPLPSWLQPKTATFSTSVLEHW